MVRPKSAGAERWASQRNGVQGDWGVPKARDAPATKKSSSMGTKFLLQEKSSSMDTKSLLREKSSNMEVRCEGVEGATAKPPPRLRRGEPPAFGKEPLWSARPAVRSRPSGATQHRWGKSGLGGASADAQSYWQGRFAACALVGDFLWSGRPRKSWGVAPNPTRELRPLTPQGGFLDYHIKCNTAPKKERHCVRFVLE